MPRHPNAPTGDTKLARLMRQERITIPFLVGTARISRRYLGELCAGRCDPTRGMMLRIARDLLHHGAPRRSR